MRCFSFILLLLSVNFPAQAQSDYIFRHLDQSDGLLHNNVLSIAQDEKGYIWILTSNGLQRYDGSRFNNYRGIVDNPSTASSNNAELYIDKKAKIAWIQKEQDLETLDLATNRITIYKNIDQLQKPSSELYTDEKNYHYVLNDNGLFWVDPNTKNYPPMLVNLYPPKTNKSLYRVTDSINDITWIAAFKGLLMLDKKTKRIYSSTYNPANNPLLALLAQHKKIYIRIVHLDVNNNLWMGSWSDLICRYNFNTKKFTTYSLNEIRKKQHHGKIADANTVVASNIFEDNHNTLWIATENAGLLKYNADQDNFDCIIADENKFSLQYNYKIITIFQDREENIWLGTDKGISIFNPYRQYYKAIHNETNNPASLPKNEIDCFIQTEASDILAGTWGGGITLFDNKWNFKKNIAFTGAYEKNMVWCFIKDDEGMVWAGCQHGYIHLIDGAYNIKTIHPPELENSTIWCMAKDSSGNIWIGLNNGKIAKWEKASKKFFSMGGAGLEKVTPTPINNIYIDAAQRCWVSTIRGGFKQFDPVKRMFINTWLPKENDPNSIAGITCEGIEKYDDSTFMIGTIYGGLNFFNINTHKFTHLNTSNGLPSNTVYAIKKDTAGYTWFTTDYDLYKFKLPAKKFTRYNIDQGIVNSIFKSVNFYVLNDGRWVTNTETEFFCFLPQGYITTSGAGGKVEITGVKLFDSSIFITPFIDLRRPLKLSYEQNFLTIEFSSLSFSTPQHTKYLYQLSDVDKDWVVTDTKKFASYTNLAPGTYTFTVKTADDADNQKLTSFDFTISPPFWQTWIFEIACVLVIAGIIYWAILKRIKAIRHEAEMKQKIAETEMMALRAQMNPHFIFNCLTSIDNLIQLNEKEKATVYLSKYAKLIRSILENSRNNVVPCWKDMETLQLYLELESLRFDKKFNYTLNVASEITAGDYKVPPLVIQPFVENAIHHGLLNKLDSDKRLWIDVSVKNNHIYYRIEDNGVGRKTAAGYKDLNKRMYESMGMQITTNRIDLHNQENNGWVKITDLLDEQGLPAGTKVEVEIINKY